MSTDPTISPDGNWRWDGTSWQPNTPPAEQATPTDTPAAASTPDAPPPADIGTTAVPATATATSVAPAADTTPAANVGDVVTVELDGATFSGFVVGVVEGSTEDYTDGDGNQQTRTLRDTGVLVARLPEPTFVPNAALRD